MKVLTVAVTAAMFVMAAPAWADRDHGRHGYVHHHVYHGPPGHVKRHFHRHYVHPRPVVRYYRPAYVVPAYPVYPAYRPAPGVHVVLPDVVIRF